MYGRHLSCDLWRCSHRKSGAFSGEIPQRLVVPLAEFWRCLKTHALQGTHEWLIVREEESSKKMVQRCSWAIPLMNCQEMSVMSALEAKIHSRNPAAAWGKTVYSSPLRSESHHVPPKLCGQPGSPVTVVWWAMMCNDNCCWISWCRRWSKNIKNVFGCGCSWNKLLTVSHSGMLEGRSTIDQYFIIFYIIL